MKSKTTKPKIVHPKGKRASKVKYTDAPTSLEESLNDLLTNSMPMEDDLLPSPEDFREMLAKEKISLNVDRRAVESFRAYSKKHGLKYQVLMNQVLSAYAKKLKV